jgi:hypothetical protein
VISYQLIRGASWSAIALPNKVLTGAPEQMPTRFRAGLDVEIISVGLAKQL